MRPKGRHPRARDREAGQTQVRTTAYIVICSRERMLARNDDEGKWAQCASLCDEVQEMDRPPRLHTAQWAWPCGGRGDGGASISRQATTCTRPLPA